MDFCKAVLDFLPARYSISLFEPGLSKVTAIWSKLQAVNSASKAPNEWPVCDMEISAPWFLINWYTSGAISKVISFLKKYSTEETFTIIQSLLEPAEKFTMEQHKNLLSSLNVSSNSVAKDITTQGIYSSSAKKNSDSIPHKSIKPGTNVWPC